MRASTEVKPESNPALPSARRHRAAARRRLSSRLEFQEKPESSISPKPRKFPGLRPAAAEQILRHRFPSQARAREPQDEVSWRGKRAVGDKARKSKWMRL